MAKEIAELPLGPLLVHLFSGKDVFCSVKEAQEADPDALNDAARVWQANGWAMQPTMPASASIKALRVLL
jgi:hypothetical protein